MWPTPRCTWVSSRPASRAICLPKTKGWASTRASAACCLGSFFAICQAGSGRSYPGYRQFAGRDQGAPCGQHHVVLGFLPGQPAQPPACQGTMGQAGTRARKVCCLGSFCAVCASRFHACMQTVARRACASDATANRTRTTIVVSLMWSTLAKDSVVTASGSMSRDSANLESICPSSTIP